MNTVAIIEATMMAAELYMRVADRVAKAKELTPEESQRITERLRKNQEWAKTLEL